MDDYIIGLVKYKYKNLNELIDHLVESEYT